MRQSSPSALRNRGPIADVLARVLPTRAGAIVLEIASGSGEHITHFKTERDPRWGVRDLEELEAHAASVALVLEQRVPMPADNFTLIWRRV